MLRRAFAALLLVPLALSAQVQQFEVASIRRHDPPLPRIDISTSGPTLHAEADNLFELIMWAYDLKINSQVSFADAESPLLDTFYDIVAKAGGERVPTQAEFRQMMQALLADRFKLKTHRETRNLQVYDLVIGKSGSKLKASAPDAPGMGRMTLEGRNYRTTRANASMNEVVRAIMNAFLDRPVVDHTGLTGTYQLDLTYTPDLRNRPANEPGDISVFTAVQEQLGLRLDPKTEPIEVLVVDSVERPTEN